ncbi:MAG: Sporulation-specific protease YabG [Syntrophomonadaceae bacterium]|nr:Sporulation-specific protease YabG [Bacillota bacterium]
MLSLSFKVGEVVGRKSYNMDLLFKILEINEKKERALLKGLDMRLLADAPFTDLAYPEQQTLQEYLARSAKAEKECVRKILRRRTIEKEHLRGKSSLAPEEYFEMPGTILHLDGDPEYLEECRRAYQALGIQAFGSFVPEKKQPELIWGLLNEYRPDILVLTGHDAYLKNGDFHSLSSYRNSSFFLEATRKARQYEPGKDDLVIFAGACQSHYEALLEAGANFASSPQRALIHALDPVFIMEKVAFTPINETVNIYEVIQHTVTGLNGVGGLETRGKFRLGLPRSPY